ncbi:hypothetical protein QAD02_010393 [Eretmocerus hayati]|uniref:Uncharacterized protein n=1 Tax=Eretmocerus hayati TaxID=131215 RepID=A0ACC2NGM2_9HYME|nr:hypothetical protein QAD02_010393 [Eretmocerus hayati]
MTCANDLRKHWTRILEDLDHHAPGQAVIAPANRLRSQAWEIWSSSATSTMFPESSVPGIFASNRKYGNLLTLLRSMEVVPARPDENLLLSMADDILFDVAGAKQFLLSRPVESGIECGQQRSKIVVVGCGPVGVAVAVSVLHKRLASELVIIDDDEEMAKAEAADLNHAATYLGCPRISGTKDYSHARDALVCVIAIGLQHMNQYEHLEKNVTHLKDVIPGVSKFAPNCIIVMASDPVDVLSFAAMKLSGFPPGRVIGLGTLLDNCRLQHAIASELGIAPSSVQSLVIGESGPTSVPVWSAVSVMGMKLKDIDKDIGSKNDPEGWQALHCKVVNCHKEMIEKKGHHCWAAGACVSEIIDAIVRNTCACMSVSTFVKGCRHGLEKDVYMSLPCVVGRAGVLSYMRHLYTTEEQVQATVSCRSIYEAQRPLLDRLD